MSSRRFVATCILGLMVLSAAGQAQSGIYVEYWNGSAWVHAPGHPDRLKNPPDPGYSSGSDIEIVNANNVTYRVFAVTPSSTDIGDISINAPSNTVQPRLLVGRFNSLTEPIASQRLDAAGGRYLSSIYSNTGKVRVQAWVMADILSGGVDTHEIVRLDVDGDILGPISHRPVSGTPTLGMMRVVGSIDPLAGAVIAFDGAIGTVQTVSGNLLCDVLALGGDIGTIQIGGDIGTPSNPVALEALTVIKYIDVPNGDLHADIVAVKLERTDGLPHDQCFDVGGNVSDTTITLTDSIRDHFTIAGGDFTASSELHLLHLADGAELKIKKSSGGIGGRLLGDMYFTGVLGAQSLIEIDRSLAGTMSFNGNGTDSLRDDIYILGDLGAGEGLTGQVILNADATANESWGSGLMKFGADSDPNQFWLSPIPYYNNKSADIGGGAVGLVPFGTHRTSCLPEHATTKAGAPASITLQFYGPVKPDDNTKMPVKVYRYTFGTFDNEVDLTADFDIEYPTDRKQIRLVPDVKQFKPRYRYRVVPITSSPGTGETLLLCDDLTTASDVPVYGHDYWLDVDIAMSTLDLSENEWVDEPDLVLWATDPQDFDGSGAADASDLTLITDNLGEPID